MWTLHYVYEMGYPIVCAGEFEDVRDYVRQGMMDSREFTLSEWKKCCCVRSYILPSYQEVMDCIDKIDAGEEYELPDGAECYLRGKE